MASVEPIVYVNGVRRVLPDGLAHFTLFEYLRANDGRRALVLVVFVGGVTFAEISALRFLRAQEGMAYDLIVGTTKIINGNTLIETFIEKSGLAT